MKLFKDHKLQESFERHGYVVFDLLDAPEIDHLLSVHRTFANRLQGDFAATLMISDLQYRRAVHEEIKSVVQKKIERILTDYRPCSCGFVIKKAMSPDSELQFHQDWSFVDEACDISVGIWCPLMDVGQQNGCLRVVPGSHKLNTKPRAQVTPLPYRKLFSTIHPKYITQIPMTAGQVLLQNQRLFHGSASNLSASERVAVYGVLVPANTPLRFYYQDLQSHPDKLEVFEVDDSFYMTYVPGRFEVDGDSVTRYVPGPRPAGFKSLGFIDYEFEHITSERLESAVSLM